MKILIIGGTGMAGHMIKDYLEQETAHDVWTTVRRKMSSQTGSQGVVLDVTNELQLKEVLTRIRPDIVINAVGILNAAAARNMLDSIYINSLFPHQLAKYSLLHGFRCIHISTDCVFSGSRGDYKEMDVTDGTDVYAKTKSMGELLHAPNVTIRTSIVGPELKTNGTGLFHWFFNQSGDIKGYRNVWWSGVTTLELAKAVHWLFDRPSIHGIVHLTSSKKINKYDLLHLFQNVFKYRRVRIHPYDQIRSDKSLINTRHDFSYHVPDYLQMLTEMKAWMQSADRGKYAYTQGLADLRENRDAR